MHQTCKSWTENSTIQWYFKFRARCYPTIKFCWDFTTTVLPELITLSVRFIPSFHFQHSSRSDPAETSFRSFKVIQDVLCAITLRSAAPLLVHSSLTMGTSPLPCLKDRTDYISCGTSTRPLVQNVLEFQDGMDLVQQQIAHL